MGLGNGTPSRESLSIYFLQSILCLSSTLNFLLWFFLFLEWILLPVDLVELIFDLVKSKLLIENLNCMESQERRFADHRPIYIEKTQP